jgi:hypothetical protein
MLEQFKIIESFAKEKGATNSIIIKGSALINDRFKDPTYMSRFARMYGYQLIEHLGKSFTMIKKF